MPKQPEVAHGIITCANAAGCLVSVYEYCTKLMVDRIHHINFLVKDIDQAISSYRDILGLGEPIVVDLPGRAVRTARFKLGDAWLVLVEPQDQDSVPAKHLAEHGEGFFLLSLDCNDLDAEIAAIASRSAIGIGAERSGLENWRVADLDANHFNGVQIQLAQDFKASKQDK